MKESLANCVVDNGGEGSMEESGMKRSQSKVDRWSDAHLWLSVGIASGIFVLGLFMATHFMGIDRARDMTDILTAYGTFFIAIFIAMIAYEQFRTARWQHRWQLYEKRYAVYEALIDFLGHVTRDGNADDAALHGFERQTREAEFLFGDDVREYLKMIREKGTLLQLTNCEAGAATVDSDADVRATKLQEARETKVWMMHQIGESNDVFMPYLRFGE